MPDRLVDHGLPGSGRLVAAVFHNVAAGLLAGAQRLDQGGPQPCGHQPAAPVERGEAVRIRRGADRREVRCAWFAGGPDEQARAPGRGWGRGV
ncbi:Uncharacterised protein [Mycobacterium tuberculosis]|nr:Uncharacterised protein [Mycobacterium tuberculosis]CNH24767.1 Uncharacterised protein [Mycobacterium tuberculosis]